MYRSDCQSKESPVVAVPYLDMEKRGPSDFASGRLPGKHTSQYGIIESILVLRHVECRQLEDAWPHIAV